MKRESLPTRMGRVSVFTVFSNTTNRRQKMKWRKRSSAAYV